MDCHSMSQMTDYLVAIVGISVLNDFFQQPSGTERALNFLRSDVGTLLPTRGPLELRQNDHRQTLSPPQVEGL
jgi:hypothetical protein